MKKNFLIFGLIAAALVFSCTKESAQDDPVVTPSENTEEPTPVTPAVDGNLLTSFGVTFEGDTKVTVNLDNGNTAIETDDEVLVFVDASNYATYKYDGSAFVLKSGTPVELSAVAGVYYPADEFEVSEGGVKFVMPNGVEATGDDFGAIAPMAGVLTGEAGNYSVELGNVASVLRVKVTADDDKEIASVTLTYGAYYAVGSKYYVTLDPDAVLLKDKIKMVYSFDASDSESETVTLNSTSNSADVLFLVPTISLVGGLTVTATLKEGQTHNGGTNSFTVANLSTTARERNKISTMNFYLGLFSGGAGTSDNPYKIANARDFKNIANYTTSGYGSIGATAFRSAYYKQTADIDLKNALLTPIGNSSTERFIGNYDGNGKELQNVNINVNAQFAAPFGYVAGNALIKDLTVTGTITKTGETNNSLAGGIAGILNGDAQITGCTNEATISSSATYTGGIAGRLYGENAKISECSNEGTVGGASNVGGIVGQQFHGIISKCVNSGSVTATADKVGGIAGELYNTDAIISQDCSNSGTVEGVNDVGGVVGLITAADLVTADNSGKVTGSGQRIGGIIGHLNNESAKIIGCSNTCNVKDAVKGAANVGGVVGLITHGTVSSCINSAQVKATDTVAGAGAGGIVGCMANDDAIVDSGSSNSGAINGTERVGGIVGILAKGTVTECANTANVSGTSYVGGIVGFAGTSAAPSAICLITSCRTNANISGTANCVGGIAGKLQNGVVVSGCYTEGNVSTSTYDVGGLVGLIQSNNNDAKARVYVYDCLANMNVSSTRASGACRTGGAVGYITTTSSQYVAIDNCGVLDVTITAAGEYVGGFAGWMTGDGTNSNRARIRNCYTLVSSVPGSSKKGGFIGAVTNKAELHYDYFVANDSSDIPSDTVKDNYTQKTATEIKSAATCTAFNGNNYSLTVVTAYKSDLNWAITNGYPVPGALIELGPEYHK